MSRLIVKGLPSYLSDARLRDHFAQKGHVTDVKLMRRPDGTSRRFGFVGFRTEEEAAAACEYFDRTYLDTSRLSVSIAKRIGDEDLVAHKERTRTRAKAPTEAKPARAKASEKSASFEEFLAVMAPRTKRKTWQHNEDLNHTNTSAASGAADSAVADDTAVDAPAAKKPKRAAEAEPAPAIAPSDGAAMDEALSDLEYMRRRMRHKVAGGDEPPSVFEQSDSDASAESEAEDEEPAAEQRHAQLAEQQRRDEEDVDTIMASGRLFVRNLPYSATEDELERFFQTYGPVEQVHIPLDAQTKASKGLAFVKFHDAAHALLAFRGRDGAIFQGRLLHVLPAVSLAPKPTHPASLKQKRLDAKKALAGKDFNWSMLYMNSDAVANSISSRMGIDKATLLSTETDTQVSPAVRLALAETRVIQETKQFFAEQGIQLDALEHVKARADDIILVKNLPYGTSGEEIRALFSRYGDVGRVLIPPANTMAVVEMPVVGEARAAFRALAYKRFRDSVLYLEKAPAAFLPPRDAASAHETISGVQGKTAPDSSRALRQVDEAPVAADATLYIKNLSFATTPERLTEAFHTLDGFLFARVQTKPDPRQPGRRLSMGYGFAGFASLAQAQQAQQKMDGDVLDGHTLSVSFARRGHDADDAAPVKAPTTKMLVKNVPFEATRKDLRELFGVHGQLKSVRLPKQVHGRTRGFAFVEFVSRREAEHAMSALRHTHLLGRHLVLEWAGDADGTASVDELRDKTRKAYVSEAERSALVGQRAKLRLGAEQVAEAVAQQKAREDDDDDDDSDA